MFTPAKITARAEAEDDFKGAIFDYADGLDYSEFEKEFEKYGEFFGETDLLSAVKKYISGDISIGYEQVFIATINSVFSIVRTRVLEIISVLFIAVFSAIVNALRPDMTDGVKKLCDFLFSALIVMTVSSVFYSFYASARAAIKDASAIVQGAYPIILTIFSTIGANGSGAVFDPAVTFLCGAFSSIICDLLLPIISLTFVFSTIGNLSDRIKLGKFGDFFKSAFKWIIGLTSLVFCFVLSVRGVVSSTFDGLSFKAIKYAFSNGVPIVSQMVQGGFDVVFASLVLIKNSVGLIAMITLLIAVLRPIIELAVTILLLRLVAACAEPLGAGFAGRSLSACADSFSLVCGLLVCAGICFLSTVFMMIVSLGGAV